MNASIHNDGTMNITESAFAFGDNASASVTVNEGTPNPPGDADLRADLAELLAQLRTAAALLGGQEQDMVTEAADEVAEELAAPTTRWEQIREALHRVEPTVAALANLAADVARIAEAVSRLLPH